MLKKLVLSLVILALKTNLVYSLEYMEFSDDFPLDALVIGAGVRVRAAANIKAKIIKKVAFGTYVQLLARSRHSDKFQGDYAYYWLKVKLPSQHIGWIWGRYIVYYYPTKQNLECNIPYQGKKYELRLVEVEYPRYIDFGNSSIPSNIEYGFGGKLMPFFMEQGNKYNLIFIRNNKGYSKSNALSSYWKIPVACCGASSYFGDCFKTSKHIYIEWIWEREEIEEMLFQIETSQKGDLQLKKKYVAQ